MVEVLCLTLAGVVGKAYRAGACFDVGAGLVETNLTLLTYTYYQKVQIAGYVVKRHAILAEFVFRDCSVRDVDVFLEDVHLVQKSFMDGVVAALELIRGSGIVFVYCNYLYVLEGDFTGLIAACKLIVKRSGGGAGCKTQPEKAVLVVFDGIFYDVCNGIGCRT